MRKNSIYCSILTLCLILLSLAGFSQINTNGGFENWTGTTPDGWLGSKSNIGDTNVIQVTSGAHSGDFACQLINTASSHKRFTTQSIHVDNTTQYVISFWVKGKGDIRVAIFDGRETGAGYSYSTYHNINSTSYQQYTDTIVAANTTDAGEFILSVRNTNADNSHLIVDDVTITAVSNEGFVAEPTVTVSGNMQSADTYLGPVTVTLSAADGVSIHYTLDGTEPNTNSALYSAPFTITESATLKAIAISGENSSNVVVREITILNIVPLFFENFETAGLNQMTVTNVSGAYEWTTGTHSGNTYAYANAFNQGATESWLITPAITPLNADGVTLSFTTAKNYTGPGIQVKYSTNYSGSGSPSSATWTDITSECTLSSGSWTWTESGDIVIGGASPLFFAWVYTSGESSAAAWELDNILVSAEATVTPTVEVPVFNPAAGTYADSVTFNLTCATDDATIYYTTDGTEPTETSTLYSTPITLTASTTVKAKAFKTDWTSSATATAAYIITNHSASNDTVIYAVGFEDEEGFTASTTYNNTTVAFTGAEGAQWGTYYGTPSTNNHITGDQSMQMRWYTSAPENIGYTYTNFDLNNVTHVTFVAASSNGLNVNVSHSIDGGINYSAGETFTLGSSANTFDYVVDENGSYDFVRLKFTIALPEANPTSTSRVVIDSLVFFGIPGSVPSIVTTPVISPNGGSCYAPQTVSITCADADAVIRYTLDGTEPTESSTVYNQPFTVSNTTTIMAKAWKEGMTPSLVATATFTFPEQVANIAAFKAAAATNEERQIMSDVTFVFRSGRYMFVEDNTAAMLIFDNSNPVITNTYNEGDVIQAGVFGKYTTYQGMVEMVPTHNANAATGTPVTVTPANATISNIKSQYTDVYESKLVHLSNVEFINATTFVQNGDTMAIYNRFNTVTTEISAGDLADVTGFVSYSTNYGYQIYPRSDEDIDIHPVVIMDTVATPEFELFKDGEFYRVNITCATEDAIIYYTIDGTDPDESSSLFDDIFPLNMQPRTLKAIATKEGMVNSAIAEYDYNPSSINNYELRDNLSVYPNPAENNVYVRAQNDNILIERVELFNALGQLLHTTEVGGTMVEIPVGTLATGTYYAKVFTDKGIVTMPVIRK